MQPATRLTPASRTYRGAITRPERWSSWTPREGDVLVTTPPKCGTTWTQSILAMLLHGGADLPAPLPVQSPWVDADLGVPVSAVADALEAQKGRRVVKTHTPADGFPVWSGVSVVAVYRHPLDVFFSLRNHVANRADLDDDHIMRGPVSPALDAYLDATPGADNFDSDALEILCRHYNETALSGRLPDITLLHYADMIQDPRGTVVRLADAAGIRADDALIDTVTEATSFRAMKAKASEFVPVGGTGFWKSDANFFESASSNKWDGKLARKDLDRFDARLAELIPDAIARAWLLGGNGTRAKVTRTCD